jgi:tetratricopeptide (TPR) repeat protein
MEKGDFAGAIPYLEKLSELESDLHSVHCNLAICFSQLGELEQAERHYLEAIKIKPRFELHSGLAQVFLRQNKYDQAIKHYKRSLVINPIQPAALYKLGGANYSMGRVEEAIKCWQKALRYAPEFTDALNDLAWVKAAGSNAQLHNPDEAIDLARKACEITSFGRPNYLDTLACAYAAAGDFSSAATTAEKAVEIAESLGEEALAENIQKHLELFKVNRSYREDADLD